jgi:hypothetical protein
MLEVLAYLRANGFKTFIASGGGLEFMRGFTDRVLHVGEALARFLVDAAALHAAVGTGEHDHEAVVRRTDLLRRDVIQLRAVDRGVEAARGEHLAVPIFQFVGAVDGSLIHLSGVYQIGDV